MNTVWLLLSTLLNIYSKGHMIPSSKKKIFWLISGW